jgi:hypothetical protein
LAAPLAPACAPLLSVAGVEVAADALAEADVVLALEGLLVVLVVGLAAVVVAPVVAVVFAFDAFAGTSPSWLSAEKMLSMNPIIPPPPCCSPCTLLPSSRSSPWPACWVPCAW